MTGVIFGLLTALAIGASDLFGRRIVHAQSPVTAAVPMQFIGIVTAAVTMFFIASEVSVKDSVFALLSGLGFATGLGCYYTGLSKASSALIAPTVAMLSAVLPFTYSVFRGSHASPLTLAGAAICLIGLAVITVDRSAVSFDWTALRWGTLSGLGYATGLITLIDVSDGAGTWPAVVQRTTACLALATVATRIGVPVLPRPNLRLSAVLAGIAVGLSTVFLLAGLEVDPTPTVVAASVFPAVTVLVGLFAYGDSVRTQQWYGIAIVILGIMAISAG
ncbi:MAG: EamA family transporter [Acidimicrobiales bacterium]|nr:EamA family transporter [Acidimicrobiales bacterium]